MAIVSTGQITIVDTNDARPITAFITTTPGMQQVFTKDESLESYTPNWQSGASLALTAKVYAGSTNAAEDVTGLLTNRKWYVDPPTATPITGTSALVSSNAQMSTRFTSGAGHTFTVVHDASGSTLTISANLLPTVPQVVVYFEGDYTDPVTGLVSHVIAQISLNVVKTGTNAVYLQIEGSTAIEQGTGATKNVTAVAARLIRAAGVDTTGITYRWFENHGADQIINTAPYNTKYGMRTTAVGAAPVLAVGNIGSNLPASAAWTGHNTLTIHESAVQDMGIYRVEAKDADGTIYQTYFTIYDVSDPYDVRINSSAGDKLQNGVGSTNLTPGVFYGSTQITDLTGWTFTWTFYNRDGKRGAFVDATRTAVSGGRTISANTAGSNAVFTYSGSPITFAAGDLLKCVTPGGAEAFFEVASGTGNTVTIRGPNVHGAYVAFANWLGQPTVNQFQNGKLFVCRGATTQGRVTTNGSDPLTVTGDDIDVKTRIFCEANRP